LVYLNKYKCHLHHQIIQFFHHSPQNLMIPIKANDNMKYLFYIIMIKNFKLLSDMNSSINKLISKKAAKEKRNKIILHDIIFNFMKRLH
jgi:hypothetical protein